MFALHRATLRPQFRHTCQLILTSVELGFASILLPCYQEIRGGEMRRKSEKKRKRQEQRK